MQHHLIEVRFEDGVYERKETVQTFSHAKKRISGSVGRRGIAEKAVTSDSLTEPPPVFKWSHVCWNPGPNGSVHARIELV
jgi:hypothetical protein